MTETTKTRTTKRDGAADLDAFRRQVREEAIRVARQQRWCDDGLNQTLRNLGLPEKRNYEIPVKIMMEVETTVMVTDAESEADARTKLFNDYEEGVQGYARSNYGYNMTVTDHQIAEWPESPDTAKVGDMDPTRAERNAAARSDTTNPGGVTRHMCENWSNERSEYCTRPRGHGGAQHVAGNGTRVTAVWPVDEQHPAA